MPTQRQRDIAELQAMIAEHETKAETLRRILGYLQEPPSLFPHDPDEVAFVRVPAIRKNATEEEIEQIYAAYPRKIGKQDALKAISKAATKHKPAFLFERVLAYAAAVALWPESEKEFVPHPSTWFNRGSYEDDPQTWTRQPPTRDTRGGVPLEERFDKF